MSQPKRWLTDEEQAMWRAWLGAQFRLRKVLDHDLEEHAGFDHLTYEIFVHLSENENHSLRMTELANRVSAGKSRLTYRVEQLEKEGLVQRKTCDEDGRGNWCTLTDNGYQVLVDTAPGHVDAVLENFIDVINPKDIGVLTHVFDSIASNVQCTGEESG